MPRMYFLKKGRFTLSFLLVLLAPAGLFAWSEHPLITYPVMKALPLVASAEPVKAEGIVSFLADEVEKLEALLAEEEAWAKGHLSWYPPRPETLAFKSGGDQETLLVRFAHAIRINPGVAFPLYLQRLPGQASRGEALQPSQLSLLADTKDWTKTAFVALAPGESVRPLDVVVSASDEPDLAGLDIGLFSDNGTEFGKVYGFGPQPFGNPNLEYGSQAPFHMGFYHESPIVYFFAGFLKRTLPEYRIHLYKSLSRFAFATGHPYWGWRFMGLGLHYLADLAQPYHATVLPGVTTVHALWINTIDLLGIDTPKKAAVQLVSNRHMALEKFLQVILQEAYLKKETGHPILTALAQTHEGPVYSDATPRERVARQAHEKADETDRLLEETMPHRFVSDPSVELLTLPEREQIVDLVATEGGGKAVRQMTLLAKELLIPFAAAGRAYVLAILEPKTAEGRP